MSFNLLLIHTVDIETLTSSEDDIDDGSPDESWAAASIDDEDVSCRIIDITGTLEENIPGRNEKSTHKILFDSNQTIISGQRINHDETYYIVEFVKTGNNNIQSFLKSVYARKIQ